MLPAAVNFAKLFVSDTVLLLQHKGSKLWYTVQQPLCRNVDARQIEQLKKAQIQEHTARSSGSVFYELAPAGGNVRMRVPTVMAVSVCLDLIFACQRAYFKFCIVHGQINP